MFRKQRDTAVGHCTSSKPSCFQLVRHLRHGEQVAVWAITSPEAAIWTPIEILPPPSLVTRIFTSLSVDFLTMLPPKKMASAIARGH
jgi:hypothetical protein